MRNWSRIGAAGVMVFVGLLTGVSEARAQGVLAPARPEAGDVELAIGLTINGAATDVNAQPACASLALPCTHQRPGSFGGFGVDVNVTRSIGQRAGITIAGGLAGYGFDSALEAQTHRSSTDTVTSLLVGPTFRTLFGRPRGPRHESDRFFCQMLIGVQDDAIFDTRPVIQVSGGADSLGRFGRNGGVGTVRMAAGYRFTPGATYASGGLWFFLGVVIGA